jgi:hypothetical protein
MEFPVKHLVMMSGGVGSWAAAKRVVEQNGTDGVVLLFADVLIEDDDLYRFLDDAQINIGVPITKISDGRTPFEVMQDEKIIGNSRIDPCSKILKRNLLDKWRDKNCNPAETTIYVGIDWSEHHRIENLNKRVYPWTYKAPMCERPFMTKQQMIKWAELEGIRSPRLYAMGFAHNNCGGMCIKAGQAQWERLLRLFPERYEMVERWEESMREKLGNHSILRDRRGCHSQPLTLREFRERITKNADMFDHFEWGGCGCAI